MGSRTIAHWFCFEANSSMKSEPVGLTSKDKSANPCLFISVESLYFSVRARCAWRATIPSSFMSLNQ